MCKVAFDICSRGGEADAAQPGSSSSPQPGSSSSPQPGSSSSPSHPSGPDVVMVVGRSHLPGLRYVWESGLWQHLVGVHNLVDSELLRVPVPPPGWEHDTGLRRGLLRVLLNQRVTREVGGAGASRGGGG